MEKEGRKEQEIRKARRENNEIFLKICNFKKIEHKKIELKIINNIRKRKKDKKTLQINKKSITQIK